MNRGHMYVHGDIHPVKKTKFCACGKHEPRFVHRNTWRTHNPPGAARAPASQRNRAEARARAAPYPVPIPDPDPAGPGIDMPFNEDVDNVNVNPNIDGEFELWCDPLWNFDQDNCRSATRSCVFTVMEAVVMLLWVFTRYAIPRDARRAIFDIIGLLLPPSNQMPKHTEVEIHLQKANKVSYRRVGTCRNNCCIVSSYSKSDFKDLIDSSSIPPERRSVFEEMFEQFCISKDRATCPHCVEDLKKMENGEYSERYKKYYYEVDLQHRIPQLFLNKEFAENVNISNKHTTCEPGKDIFSSIEWKNKVVDKGIHQSNQGRDLVLCLLADGVCPFTRRKQHSMDVSGFYIMNLDKRYRNSVKNILMTGIVGGPEKVRDSQPYILSLIIQLLEIERQGGLRVPDVNRPGHWFTVRLHVLWTLGDLPAHAKLWNWAEHTGYSACVKCTQPGEHKCNRMHWGHYLEHANYEQHAQCYPPRSAERVWQNSVTARGIKRAEADSKYNQFVQQNGTKGVQLLTMLGMNAVTDSWFDIMHVMKGWFVHIIYTLKGERTPKAASAMSAAELQSRALDQVDAVDQQASRSVTLSSAQMKLVEARQETIHGPPRFSVRGKGIFRHSGMWKVSSEA